MDWSSAQKAAHELCAKTDGCDYILDSSNFRDSIDHTLSFSTKESATSCMDFFMKGTTVGGAVKVAHIKVTFSCIEADSSEVFLDSLHKKFGPSDDIRRYPRNQRGVAIDVVWSDMGIKVSDVTVYDKRLGYVRFAKHRSGRNYAIVRFFRAEPMDLTAEVTLYLFDGTAMLAHQKSLEDAQRSEKEKKLKTTTDAL